MRMYLLSENISIPMRATRKKLTSPRLASSPPTPLPLPKKRSKAYTKKNRSVVSCVNRTSFKKSHPDITGWDFYSSFVIYTVCSQSFDFLPGQSNGNCECISSSSSTSARLERLNFYYAQPLDICSFLLTLYLTLFLFWDKLMS